MPPKKVRKKGGGDSDSDVLDALKSSDESDSDSVNIAGSDVFDGDDEGMESEESELKSKREVKDEKPMIRRSRLNMMGQPN